VFTAFAAPYVVRRDVVYVNKCGEEIGYGTSWLPWSWLSMRLLLKCLNPFGLKPLGVVVEHVLGSPGDQYIIEIDEVRNLEKASNDARFESSVFVRRHFQWTISQPKQSKIFIVIEEEFDATKSVVEEQPADVDTGRLVSA